MMEKTPEIKNVKTEECIPMPELGRNFYDTKHYFSLKQALEKEGWKPNYPASAIFNKELSKWEIYVGVHRLKIAKEIGLPTIPLVPSTIPRDRAIAEGINSNLRQGPYNAVDIAHHLAALGNMFVRLSEHTIPSTGGRPAEYNMRAIAKEYGFGLSTVHMYLSLLKLPEEEQTLVGSGKLCMKHAIALLPLEDPLKIAAMRERCIRESWTVSETERRVEIALKNPNAFTETFKACQGCGRAFAKDKMTRLEFCPRCVSKIKDGYMSGPINTAEEDGESATEYMRRKNKEKEDQLGNKLRAKLDKLIAEG